MKKIALTFSLLLSACVAHGDGSGAIEETSGNNLVFERYELDCGADPEGSITLNLEAKPLMTIYLQTEHYIRPYDLADQEVDSTHVLYDCTNQGDAKIIFVLVRPE